MGSASLRLGSVFGFTLLALTVPRVAAADIFENSVRRDPTAAEIARVGRIQETCTLFFLENTANTVYAVTARHCFDNHNINTWCEIDGVFSTADNPGSSNGQCLQVIATDAKHDIAVFEARVSGESLTGPLFRLASYTPDPSTHISLTGYPSDDERLGSITTTTDCWVLDVETASPFNDSRMSDKSVHHNCSVWGGNSGGPVWVDGTRDVVGLPFNYHQQDSDDEVLSSSDTKDAPSIALMSDFIDKHESELRAAGIVISSSAQTNVDIENGESLSDDDDDTGLSSGTSNGTPSPGAKKLATANSGLASKVGCAAAPGPADSRFGIIAVIAFAITAGRRRRSSPGK